MADLLDQMVVVQSQRMRPLPPRVDKAALRDYAQLQQRSHLAALAHRIAAFAEGMRAMEKCDALLVYDASSCSSGRLFDGCTTLAVSCSPHCYNVLLLRR